MLRVCILWNLYREYVICVLSLILVLMESGYELNKLELEFGSKSILRKKYNSIK